MGGKSADPVFFFGEKNIEGKENEVNVTERGGKRRGGKGGKDCSKRI
jgi:hypothetical protein